MPHLQGTEERCQIRILVQPQCYRFNVDHR